MTRSSPIVASLALLALSACAGGHQSAFERAYVSTPVNVTGPMALPNGPPTVIQSSQTALSADFDKLLGQGYALLGKSVIEGPRQMETGAVAQAGKVGASVVLMVTEYGEKQAVERSATIAAPPAMHTGANSATSASAQMQSMTSHGSVDLYVQAAFYFAKRADVADR